MKSYFLVFLLCAITNSSFADEVKNKCLEWDAIKSVLVKATEKSNLGYSLSRLDAAKTHDYLFEANKLVAKYTNLSEGNTRNCKDNSIITSSMISELKNKFIRLEGTNLCYVAFFEASESYADMQPELNAYQVALLTNPKDVQRTGFLALEKLQNVLKIYDILANHTPGCHQNLDMYINANNSYNALKKLEASLKIYE